jgi:hypothetical protein
MVPTWFDKRMSTYEHFRWVEDSTWPNDFSDGYVCDYDNDADDGVCDAKMGWVIVSIMWWWMGDLLWCWW